MKRIIILTFLALCFGKVLADNYNVQSHDNYNLAINEEKTLFILDFSNSMNEYLFKERKVDTMLETMRNILPKINPQKIVGMRAYGYKMGFTPIDACKASKLMVPMVRGGSTLIEKSIEKTKAVGMTPITYSLKLALDNDFAGFYGQKHIILLTDGGENCDESPCTFMMKRLKGEPKLKIDVIAYDIRNPDDISQLECVAYVTKGQFYNVETAAELAKGLNNSLDIKKEVEAKIIPH
ncbi:MAG: hypothetical protein ACI4SM_04470 [Candidatus Gastranaerophilaceae bacterium]